jgi:hypothetical protein
LFNPRANDKGATVATSGYGEIAVFGREQSKLKMHVLSHYLHTGEQPVPCNPKKDVSHLCHSKSCFNPAHLVLETVPVNGSRDYCLSTVQSKGGQFIDVCCHTPKCLKAGAETKQFVAKITEAKTLVDEVIVRKEALERYHKQMEEAQVAAVAAATASTVSKDDDVADDFEKQSPAKKKIKK